MRLIAWCGFFTFVLSGCVVPRAHAFENGWERYRSQHQELEQQERYHQERQRDYSERQWQIERLEQQQHQADIDRLQEKSRLDAIEHQLRQLR